MEFQVNTNNVILAQINQVESGEYNVTECRFIFSSEYEGLTKIAVFTGANGDAYKITILNNKCEIPSELLTESQIVQIGVYAYEVQGTEFVLRYSPMPTRFMIEKGSYVVNAVNMSRPTPTEVEQLQSQITHNANNIEGIQGDIAGINQELVGINGELLGINRDIDDIKAEQTEQNTKIQKNTDDIVEINQNINEIDSSINVINQNIDNLEQDLTNYSLITETGSQINLNVNSTNYQITAILKDKNGNVIYTSNAIDLPIESMIINARYDNQTKEIVLTLQNGNTLRISVADLISGLVSETQLQTILANYYTKTEVDNLLSEKANQTSLDATNQNVTNLAGRVSTNETDIANIKEEQTTQNTNIEELQTQVETLQEDLESANAEIEELNTDITNMAKAMYKVDGQGSDITLQNTSENKFVEFGLEGRTEQEQLEGKNLFNPLLLSQQENYNTYNSSTGLWTTSSRNAWYLSILYYISGNATRDINKLIYLPQGKYTIRIYDFVNNTGHSSPISYRLFNNLGEEISSSVSGSTTYVLNIEQDCYLDICRTNSTGTLSFSKIMIVSGEYTEQTMPSFERYCGGIPAPNPDYPQQIKNVTGNANVKIQNKNLAWNGWAEDFVSRINNSELANLETYENRNCLRYNAGAGSGDYDNKYIFKINWKENTQYTLSYYAKSSQGYLNLSIEYTDGTTSSIDGTPITSWTKVTLTSTANKTIKYIRARFTAGATYIDLDTFMVLEGVYTAETIPDYVPHQEQNYPFTFAEGQRLYKYEKLTDNGKDDIWGEYIFTGNENWLDYSNTQTGNYYRYYSIDVKLGRTNYYEEEASCTHFRNNNFKIDSQGIALTKNATYISIDKTIASSTEELKQWFATQYNNGNPVKVQFIKSNPTIIPYNATQQAEYDAKKQARSYDDITYITSTSDELGFNMNVVAVADANKVIENQNSEIDTIKSRLDLLEG